MNVRMFRHSVRFFSDRKALVDEVCDFAAIGFELDERVVLALEEDNEGAVRHELGNRGLDCGRVDFLSAEDLAGALGRPDGGLDGEAFERRVGEAIAKACSRGPVRVYGEIVNVLWRGGQARGSEELERAWGRLGGRHGFTLLCGYRIDLLKEGVDVWSQVSAHQHVLPDPTMRQLDSMLESAVERVLGPQTLMVRSLIAEDERLSLLPFGQAALLWLRRHMPLLAQKILSPATLLRR